MWTHEYANMFDLEEGYWWYRGLHELIESYVRARALQGKLCILDVGCGTGQLMSILSRYGDVEGFDFSNDAVEYSKRRGLKHVTVCDLNSWNGPPERYDVITCIDVLCHQAVKDELLILRKLYRSLRPGAVLIVNLPAFEILRRGHDVVVQTTRRRRKGTMSTILRQVGFRSDVLTYRLPALFLFLLLRRLLRLDSSSHQPTSDLRPLPPSVNRLALATHRVENNLLRLGLRFPVGSSLFVVATKPA